jgi:hypothetical protein
MSLLCHGRREGGCPCTSSTSALQAGLWEGAGRLTLYTAESSFGFEVGMRRASFLSNKTESTVDNCQVETFRGVGRDPSEPPAHTHQTHRTSPFWGRSSSS